MKTPAWPGTAPDPGGKPGFALWSYDLRLRDLAAAALFAVAPAAANAHPHEWIDVATEVVFDNAGQITAIRHHWRFDEAFSTFALQGLDTDGDGLYSARELEPLAQENVQSLADYEFFTYLSAGDYQAGFAAPKDYHLELDNEFRLTLHYTLPLAQPFSTQNPVLLQVFDPEFYIAMTLPSAEAVRLVDAPPGCRLTVTPAEAPDPAAAAALAEIGPEQRELPENLQELATNIENSAEINCGGPTVAAAPPATAADAVSQMASAGPGDLTALPAEPDGSGAALAAIDAPASAAPPPAAEASQSGVFARIGAMQAGFTRDLNAALKGIKADGTAFWWLAGISFLYGIVHAAGPGHGKVVISSYLVANEQRLRRGVLIAFLSAAVQAIVAIGVVGIMAVLLNMTSMAITRTAGAFETASFALVAALGLYLLATKGRRAWAMAQRPSPSPSRGGTSGGASSFLRAPSAHREDAHRHHDQADHQHGPSCGCAHHAAPAALEKPGWSGAAAAVLSVGMRPCSGALVVLVFALAQGIFWAGIASTFLMALGTAITVAVLAALAVGAKDIARRLTRGDGRRSAQVMLALELTAALFITALGATLFAGSLAA